ncbi:MAG TPA: hypothetical protein GX012_02795 [Acholeplasma sp.]|nr:hypothetical protein [Acholeplasma sp.]
MQNNSMVALGHNENVYVFSAIGIEGIIIDEKSFKDVLKDLITREVKIIIVSQHFQELLEEVKKEYQAVYPIFITLQMEFGEESNAVDNLRKNVEKATGINLF